MPFHSLSQIHKVLTLNLNTMVWGEADVSEFPSRRQMPSGTAWSPRNIKCCLNPVPGATYLRPTQRGFPPETAQYTYESPGLIHVLLPSSTKGLSPLGEKPHTPAAHRLPLAPDWYNGLSRIQVKLWASNTQCRCPTRESKAIRAR